MKKLASVFIGFMVLVVFCGCGQGKYDDAVKVNEDFVKITEKYINDLDHAESGADVARAINDFTEKFEQLIPKMNEIHKKYPDMMTSKDLPEKLKKTNERAEQAGVKLASSFMRIMKYMADPEVMEAHKKFAKTMQEMNK